MGKDLGVILFFFAKFAHHNSSDIVTCAPLERIDAQLSVRRRHVARTDGGDGLCRGHKRKRRTNKETKRGRKWEFKRKRRKDKKKRKGRRKE